VRLRQSPVGPQSGTSGGIVGRTVAGSTDGHGSNQTTADGVVE
jgi:hypothetical protein